MAFAACVGPRSTCSWRESSCTTLAHLVVAVYEPFTSSFWPAAARQQFEDWRAESETFAMEQLAADEWRAGAYRGEFPSWVEMTLRYLSEG